MDLSSPAVILHATGITQLSTTSSYAVEDSGNANPDDDFRFASGLGPTGGYIFNLSTKGLTTGTYSLALTAGSDPVPHYLLFQVR